MKHSTWYPTIDNFLKSKLGKFVIFIYCIYVHEYCFEFTYLRYIIRSI